MTCKDCIHFKLCDEFGVFDEDIGNNINHKTCHDFLNKKQFNTGQFITQEELNKPEPKSITYSSSGIDDPWKIVTSPTSANGGNYHSFEKLLKLKNIKTVCKNNCKDFDETVKYYLDTGYILKKRYISDQGCFIAEMELWG